MAYRFPRLAHRVMHASGGRGPYQSVEWAQSLLLAPATAIIGCGAAEIPYQSVELAKLKHSVAEAHLQLPSAALIEYDFPVLSQAVTHAATVCSPSQVPAGEQSTAVAMLTQDVGVCGAGGDGGRGGGRGGGKGGDGGGEGAGGDGGRDGGRGGGKGGDGGWAARQMLKRCSPECGVVLVEYPSVGL